MTVSTDRSSGRLEARGRPGPALSFRRAGLARRLALGAFLTFGLVVNVGPILWVVLSGFKTLPEVKALPIQFLPGEWQWANYAEIFRVTPLGRGFLNTVLISGGITLGVLITSLIAGYGLAALRFPGRRQVLYLVLATMLIPFFLQAIPLFVVVSKLGWVNTYQAQMVPFLVSAFGIFLIRQYVLTIPRELYDAARIDGCSELRILLEVVLPLAKPAVSALAIITFLDSWDQLFWPMLVARLPELYPLPLAVFNIQGQFSRNDHLLMAATALAMIPAILLYLGLQKRVIEGVVLSGIKG